MPGFGQACGLKRESLLRINHARRPEPDVYPC
jgi:hypothetical protein